MTKLNEEILKKSGEVFHVNEVTEFLNITPRVLKHYETTNVLQPSRNNENDYRNYTAEDIIKIQTAEHLKQTGMTSRDISNYFSVQLDIKATFEAFSALRDRVVYLLDILNMDLNPTVPFFFIEQEKTKLCLVRTFSFSNDMLKKYIDSRDTYTTAIRAGLKCDNSCMFFVKYDRFAQDVYHVCLPVLDYVDASRLNDGEIRPVTRKKSAVVKMSGTTDDISKLRPFLYDNIARLGLKTNGIEWLVSEMGPNRKTAQKLHTLIVGAELC